MEWEDSLQELRTKLRSSDLEAAPVSAEPPHWHYDNLILLQTGDSSPHEAGCNRLSGLEAVKAGKGEA